MSTATADLCRGRAMRSRALLLVLSCSLMFAVAAAQDFGIGHRRTVKDAAPRKEVSLFVGVQTGFGYRSRRDVLRQTWFPASQDALKSMEAEKSIAMRFVIGYTDSEEKMQELKAEVKEFGGFLRIPHMESYQGLTKKTHVFFKTVLRMYSPKYLFKVDDDVYLQLDRLPLLVPQYTEMQKDYIGCFLYNTPVIKDGTKYPQWVEPQASLLGDTYVSYARGSAYMLSAQALGWLSSIPPRGLRYFRNEDVTVGMWMASFNATHYEDTRLCAPACSPTSVAVLDTKVCTSCDASQALLRVHAQEVCHTAPDFDDHGRIPLHEPLLHFDKLDEEVQVLRIHHPPGIQPWQAEAAQEAQDAAMEEASEQQQEERQQEEMEEAREQQQHEQEEQQHEQQLHEQRQEEGAEAGSQGSDGGEAETQRDDEERQLHENEEQGDGEQQQQQQKEEEKDEKEGQQEEWRGSQQEEGAVTLQREGDDNGDDDDGGMEVNEGVVGRSGSRRRLLRSNAHEL